MARRGVKRPAVRVCWELEEYTLGRRSLFLPHLTGFTPPQRPSFSKRAIRVRPSRGPSSRTRPLSSSMRRPRASTPKTSTSSSRPFLSSHAARRSSRSPTGWPPSSRPTRSLWSKTERSPSTAHIRSSSGKTACTSASPRSASRQRAGTYLKKADAAINETPGQVRGFCCLKFVTSG